MDLQKYDGGCERTTGRSSESWAEWIHENVHKPSYNAAIVGPHNALANIVSYPALIGKRDLAELSSNPDGFAVCTRTISGGVAGLVPYVLAGKISGGLMRGATSKLSPHNSLRSFCRNETVAMVTGAALFDGARDLAPGETRLGNVIGGASAFAVFGYGNSVLSRANFGFADRLVAQAAIGAVGGETQLAASKLASWQPVDRRELQQAAVHGAAANLFLPAASHGFEKLLQFTTAGRLGSPQSVEPLPFSDRSPAESTLRSNGPMAVLGRWVFGEPPPPVRHGETVYEMADALRLKQIALTPEQARLAYSPILTTGADDRGSMGHEKYRVTLAPGDGTAERAIVRHFQGIWRQYERFRQEQATYHLNRLVGFENGFPETCLRLFQCPEDGRLRRAWIQSEAGIELERALMSKTRLRYGTATDENLVRLIEEDPVLYSRLEEAFAERLLIGDKDPHSKNMMMLSDGRVRNIDLDCAFHWSKEPEVISSPAYGVNHTLLLYFSDRPMSASLTEKFGRFAWHHTSCEAGITALENIGLKRIEAQGIMLRARWFALNGRFPEVKELALM